MSLYKIEIMKIRLSAYLWAMLGIFVSLLALGILFLFLGNSPEEDIIFRSWNGLVALLTAITCACFGIFSAVMAAKIIVDEYCGKNAAILFNYPVSRKKILNIKCGIVCGVTIISAFASNISVIGILYIIAKIFGIAPGRAEGHFMISVLLSGFFTGILSSAIGMIAAVVGWKKRSIMAAMICSLVLVCFVPNLIAGFSNNIVLGMFIIGAVLVLFAGIMYHILANGIERMEI